MRVLDTRRIRRGVAAVEAAIVVPVFLTTVLGMLDLSIGVMRQNILSQAARHAARQAIVHGQLCPASWNGGPWGTATTDVAASSDSVPIVQAIRPFLVGCDLGSSRIIVEWPDGNNELESRVRVTVTSPYQPMMTFIFGNPTFTLRATSTMSIAH